MSRAILDPDNPPLTVDQLAKLRPVNARTLAIVRKGRGRPPSEAPKEQVTLRLDKDVIDHFKKEGPGWQTRINAFLRSAARLNSLADRASFASENVTQRASDQGHRQSNGKCEQDWRSPFFKPRWRWRAPRLPIARCALPSCENAQEPNDRCEGDGEPMQNSAEPNKHRGFSFQAGWPKETHDAASDRLRAERIATTAPRSVAGVAQYAPHASMSRRRFSSASPRR